MCNSVYDKQVVNFSSEILVNKLICQFIYDGITSKHPQGCVATHNIIYQDQRDIYDRKYLLASQLLRFARELS